MARIAATKPPTVDTDEGATGTKETPATKQDKVGPSDKAVAVAKALSKNDSLAENQAISPKPDGTSEEPESISHEAIAIAPTTQLPKMLEDTVYAAPGLGTTSVDVVVKDKDSQNLDKKKAHSLVERRRRDKINQKISSLQEVVPEYVVTKTSSKSQKMHKSNVLENTLHYIQDLESALFKFDPTVRLKIHESAKDNSVLGVDTVEEPVVTVTALGPGPEKTEPVV